MKVTYLQLPPTRTGEEIRIRDIEEGERVLFYNKPFKETYLWKIEDGWFQRQLVGRWEKIFETSYVAAREDYMTNIGIVQ